MSRNLFNAATSLQFALRKNQCSNLNKLGRNLILTKYISGKGKYSESHGYLKYPMTLRNKDRTHFFMFGGILTFLGLKSKEEEEETELIMMIKRGILHIQRSQYEEAENILHDALKKAHETQKKDGITYIYDVLANLFFQIGRYKEAEKLFIEVMKNLLNKGFKESCDQIAHISLKLAKIYEMEKDYRKAESGYQYCIQALESNVKALGKEILKTAPTVKLWILSLNSYGRFLVNQSRAVEALEYFKIALHISLEVNGKQHEDTALLLNDMGTASHNMGDLNSAISYTEEAAEIGIKVGSMEDLVIIYTNLTNLYLSKGLYNKAKLASELAMKYARGTGDKDSINMARELCKIKVPENNEN